ncbi:hypothetical protein JWG40_02585, partial [Leptospira sp. 201903074]|uniref:hypothetical protein n=1 Tax=Leptospira abararensis TaxID=2810036 RepID=UPI001966B6E9
VDCLGFEITLVFTAWIFSIHETGSLQATVGGGRGRSSFAISKTNNRHFNFPREYSWVISL